MSKQHTALDIYYNASQMPAINYVDELRKAVYREVSMGSCRLIEDLIMNPLNSSQFRHYVAVEIPMLSYHAIDYALKALESGGDFQDLGIGIQTRYSFYPWDDFNSSLANQLVYTLDHEQLQHLGNRYTKLCSNSKTSVSWMGTCYNTITGSDKKTEKNLEKARKDAAEITAKAEREANRTIRDANEAAQRITEDARNRAANTQAQANTEADRTRRNAENEADRTRRNAENQAEQTRRNAENQAEQTRRNADEYAARIKRTAEDDADGIRAAARQQMEEEAERTTSMLIQQKLTGYIQELRRQWEEEQREKASQRADTSALVADLKVEACTRSTTIGANLNQSLDQLQEQLNQLRSNMTLDMQQWRTSLYKCEYGKLVNFYNTLNGYANSFEKELREAECSDTASDEMKTVLGEHSRKMNRLRSNLIGAMETMGLRLFTPQNGELFNSYYHTTNGEEDDDVFLDREIERCLKPGIERVVNDREVAVLLRASVEVRMD